MDLHTRRCAPCTERTPKLDSARAQQLLEEIPGWEIRDDKLERRFKFVDFLAAIRFVNHMAEIAEGEGHHPDFCVHYNRVDVTIWTHAIGGLSENDFILAAKLSQL